MSTVEKVKYEIDAEDKATAKIRKASEAVAQSVEKVKQLGATSKNSAEFFGTFASSLGGTEIGGFAGQIGGLIEKTSAFGEVAKTGGVGALAFKAGLIGAVAVISTQVGSAIGNAIFQTEKWNNELKATLDTMNNLGSVAIGNLGKQFDRERKRIGLILDPVEQEKASEQLTASVKQSLDSALAEVQHYKKTIEEKDTVFNRTFNQADIDVDKAGLKLAEQKLDALRKQKEVLDEQNSEYTKMFAKMEADNKAAQERTANQEKLKKAGLDLVRSIEEQWAKANEKKIADQNQIVKSQLQSVEALRQQAFEMANGKEAADRARLEQQGFDSATADRLAQMQSELGKQVSEKAPAATGPQSLEARDMRFGSGLREQQEQRQREEQSKAQADYQKRIEEAQEKQRVVAAQMLEELKKIAAKKELELVTV
jgi:hypothetical protein